MNIKKRFITYVSAIIMIISLFSGSAFASTSPVVNQSASVKSVVVGDQTISYTVREHTSNAKKADRTIFLVHGAGANSVSTESLAVELNKLFTKAQIVQIDLPAHGLSKGPVVPSIYDMSTIVDKVIQQGRVSGEFANRFVVAGISMGGSIAQTLAVRNVDGLEKVVLISTSPEWSHMSVMADWTADFFAENYPGMIEGDYAVNTTPEQQAAFHLWFPSTMSDVQTSLSDVKALIGFNITKDLTKITKKTLIISGTADATAPYTNSQLMAASIKKSTLVTVPGETHTYSMKQPATVAKDIFDFVK